MSSHQCIGVLLAGGRSSRMGEDKALLMRNKQSMLAFSRDMLHQCGVDDVVISGQSVNGIADIVPDGGPLGGIWSVLSAVECQSMIILPVDMPLINVEALTVLKNTGLATGKAQYFNHVSLPAFIPVTDDLRHFLKNALTSEKFTQSKRTPSLRALFQAIDAQSIPLSDEQCLFNANTPQQWAYSQTLISL